MKITCTLALGSAVLLAAGCAHERHEARYDNSFLSDYAQAAAANEPVNAASGSTMAPVNSANMNATSSADKSRSESDNAIVSSVRESLRRNAEIAPIAPNIQITANNGAVQLSGWVQSSEQKNQIGAIARQATGVLAVNNQLQAIPTPASPPATAENPPGNPILNPTSSSSNNPPSIYEKSKETNAPENAPLKPTSAPSSPSRVYQPDSQDHPGQVPETNNTMR